MYTILILINAYVYTAYGQYCSERHLSKAHRLSAMDFFMNNESTSNSCVPNANCTMTKSEVRVDC